MLPNSLFIKKSFFLGSKRTSILNDYDFQRQLGKGTYGTVYKAKMKNKNNVYRAIKKIQKQQIRYLNQFISEIQILKELDHPNILKLYETYENDDYVYLVTDLFEGGELFERLEKKGEFSETEARQIFIQILEAINYCHLHRVCHRDIKPENLLFLNNKSLNLKLIDFGLAFKWQNNMKTELKLKRQNQVVGTPYYIAPEVLKGSYDERCDLWSLGVILYILVTANPPFNGKDDQEITTKIKSLKYSVNCEAMKSVSIELKDLVVRTLLTQDKRLTIEDIFNHPWITQKPPLKRSLKLNFKKLTKYSKFSKLKTIAVTYIASQLGEKDIQKLGEVFREIDTNHDGYLSIEEIKSALAKQKQKVGGQELKQLLDFIDTDKNGKINYTEFISSCLQNSIVYKQENLIGVFKMLDKDSNGFIELHELKQVLGTNQGDLLTGGPMNKQAIQEIIKKCDKNKDGKIDYHEFLTSVCDL